MIKSPFVMEFLQLLQQVYQFNFDLKLYVELEPMYGAYYVSRKVISLGCRSHVEAMKAKRNSTI